MYTQISVEMITQQKLKELRSAAETNRLLAQANHARQKRSSIILRLFAWLFKKPGDRQEARPAGSEGSPHVFLHTS